MKLSQARLFNSNIVEYIYKTNRGEYLLKKSLLELFQCLKLQALLFSILFNSGNIATMAIISETQFINNAKISLLIFCHLHA